MLSVPANAVTLEADPLVNVVKVGRYCREMCTSSRARLRRIHAARYLPGSTICAAWMIRLWNQHHMGTFSTCVSVALASHDNGLTFSGCTEDGPVFPVRRSILALQGRQKRGRLR